ncbi:type II toxin-antitoxin system RelE/ParE family toxin [Anaerovorax odorimutans]|uniref:type II toxin-antitoxin system RelE/ParE family toxin n=1 Tax=Anaerovorax odorimutans TaxID=109327 RepID=UPI0003FE15B5|nr:type II toxin-antitoxin system RelE/ParE family toxin [Anaerovorax odorimutans]
MYKLIVTKSAHEDLDNIISYIALQLSNPAAATNFVNEIEKCYDNLKRNPLMYELCYNMFLENQGYRKATIKNYVLIYKADESSKEVIIYRFFYGGRDYLKLI